MASYEVKELQLKMIGVELINIIKKYLKRIFPGFLSWYRKRIFPDIESEFWPIFDFCRPYTLSSTENLYHLYRSVRYIESAHILGDIVECGVWRGGSAMLMAITLNNLGNTKRTIYLYDTYSGMTPPTSKDIQADSGKHADKFLQNGNKEQNIYWCYSELDEVQSNMAKTGYPEENIVYVAGRVETTIPGTAPDCCSILHLDTDWYESTFHEMTYLYPLLTVGGIIIQDDYGFWQGAKEATDNYIEENKLCLFLNRIDRFARSGVKT
jgi:O-methyltransferase